MCDQGVRNVSFSENFVCVLNGSSLSRKSGRCSAYVGLTSTEAVLHDSCRSIAVAEIEQLTKSFKTLR